MRYLLANNFLYNGKELQTDLNLGWYDYGARLYDASLGRFFAQDRFAEKYYDFAPYQYGANNPINVIDINGDSTFVVANDDGTYRVTSDNLDNPDDRGVYMMGENGYVQVGETVTSISFFDNEGNIVKDAVIDPSSTEGQDFIDDEIIEANPSLAEYGLNAYGSQDLDFNVHDMDEGAEGVSEDQHVYRGSDTKDRKFGSARDFGRRNSCR